MLKQIFLRIACLITGDDYDRAFASSMRSQKKIRCHGRALVAGSLSAMIAGFLCFGLWGLCAGLVVAFFMIIPLDKGILRPSPKATGLQRTGMFVTRIVFFLVLGFLVAAMTDSHIYDTQIDTKLGIMAAEDQKDETAVYDEALLIDMKELKSKFSVAEARSQELADQLSNETAGKGVSGKHGSGPAAQTIQNELDYSRTQEEQLSKRLDILRERPRFESSISVNDYKKNFPKRLEALHHVISTVDSALLLFWCIYLGILILDAVPLIIHWAEKNESLTEYEKAEAFLDESKSMLYREEEPPGPGNLRKGLRQVA